MKLQILHFLLVVYLSNALFSFMGNRSIGDVHDKRLVGFKIHTPLWVRLFEFYRGKPPPVGPKPPSQPKPGPKPGPKPPPKPGPKPGTQTAPSGPQPGPKPSTKPPKKTKTTRWIPEMGWRKDKAHLNS